MSVTCCPLSSSDEYATCGTTVFPRARREHRCVECREIIPIGAKYERASGIFDGSPFREKTCMSCVEIRNHFACGGWIYGQVWEDIRENFFPDMKAGGPCMEGLSPEAKGRLFELRMKWLEKRDS